MKVKSYCFLIIVLIAIEGIQSTEKPVKKVIVIGQSGSGKSTLSNFVCKTKKFKTKSGFDSQTYDFQTEKLNLEDYNLELTDTQGFKNSKKQDNWDLLNRITKFIKEEKIDFVILVLNYSIREQNESNIMKSIKYSLPLDKTNSLILVNRYTPNQDIQDDLSVEEQPEEHCESTGDNIKDSQNCSFMDFLSNLFINSNIVKIAYNQNPSETKQEFKHFAKMDHSNVFHLEERIEFERKKNANICYSKYHAPLHENIQKKIEENVIIIEIDSRIKMNDQIIQQNQHLLDTMRPEKRYTTGMWWWKEEYRYFTVQQVHQMQIQSVVKKTLEEDL